MALKIILLVVVSLLLERYNAFTLKTPTAIVRSEYRNDAVKDTRWTKPSTVVLCSSPNSDNNNNEQYLAEKFGGYTTKQRLREEIESPFRNVRLFFFGSSAGSAFVAFYFSALATLKSKMGGYSDAIPLDEALKNLGINAAGVIVFAGLAWREYQVGEANLKRIARGGALAALGLSPCVTTTTSSDGSSSRNEDMKQRVTMANYRRTTRVLVAVGGTNYIQNLAKSLNSDQRSDTNNMAEAITAVDMIVVPVLLRKDKKVGDTRNQWMSTVPTEGVDRNFDIHRSDSVLAFPVGTGNWDDYLESEIEQFEEQGYDSIDKGFTIVIKKNGKILRRASGQPQWGDLVGAMEVLDGSKFGMPGDSERYGGP